MTALIPTTIDLDGSGTSSSPATLVGGTTPWDLDDADTTYISMVPSPANSSYCDLILPAGLPQAWFSNPTYDINVRRAGSAAQDFRILMHAPGEFGGISFIRNLTLSSSYAVQRFVETGDAAFAAAAWVTYVAGGVIRIELFSGTIYGTVGVPDPALASARITYFACWVDDALLDRIPLRGRQRGSGVSGPYPLRGRNTAPYGLRGRQEPNR